MFAKQALSANIPVRQYLDLLNTYLKAQKGRVLLLALLLFASICLQLLSPQVIRTFIDTVQGSGSQQALITSAIAFLVIVLMQRVVNVLVTYVSQHVAWTATNGLRSDLTRHVLKLDMPFHNGQTPGELLQRIDGDVNRLANFFSQFLLQIFSGALLTVGVLVLLFLEDWRIGALLAFFVVAYLVVHVWDQRWAAPEWRKEREYSAEMSGFVEERIAGVRDIQTSGAVDFTLRRFYDVLRRRQWQALRADVITDLGWALSKTFYDMGTVAGMAMGAYLYLVGSITLGTVFLIIYYLGILNGPLNRIARQLEDLQPVRVSIERVSALLDTQSCLVDGSGNLPGDEPLAVAFDHVSFGYQPETPVLHDLSFSLQPGQVLGLLGRTGSGKTTLSRLLFRLYDADAGAVKLDSIDVRDVQISELRQRVGLVTQDVQIFQASVRDNLTLFDPSIPDAAILEAIRALGLEDWLNGLSDGLATELLAGNGVGLSAGEGQLLALARVFLKKPGLVILDEASSRLDPATERLLERALDGLLSDRTCIIIAHRLSSVQRADTILILEKGEVKESGAYEQLSQDPDSTFFHLLRTGLEDVLA